MQYGYVGIITCRKSVMMILREYSSLWGFPIEELFIDGCENSPREHELIELLARDYLVRYRNANANLNWVRQGSLEVFGKWFKQFRVVGYRLEVPDQNLSYTPEYFRNRCWIKSNDCLPAVELSFLAKPLLPFIFNSQRFQGNLIVD